MKKTINILLVAILFTSCVSSVKYLQRGDYDAAIRKSSKTLIKKPDKAQEIVILRKAYDLANKQDQEAIDRLKMSGQPDIYDKVLFHYSRMDERQEVVERLPQQVLNDIGFQYVDYSRKLAESKNKAAAFYYAHAEAQLEEGDKYSARNAYDELLRVKEFYPVYRDTDSLINVALFRGTNHVLFNFSNESKTILPEDFEKDLMKISLDDMNMDWVHFNTYPVEGIQYVYTVYLYLKEINVSPEFVKEEHYTETREVEDGFDYVVDKNGNVMKDSLGNDLKMARYVTLSCDVVETSLHKNAQVRGSLDIVDNYTNQLLKTQEVEVVSNFDHRFAVYRGDKDALSKKTRKLTRNKPAPFPSDAQMIFNTNEGLKERAKYIISRNEKILAR
jgi:tetratricopeptide (TPR) repeat protein